MLFIAGVVWLQLFPRMYHESAVLVDSLAISGRMESVVFQIIPDNQQVP